MAATELEAGRKLQTAGRPGNHDDTGLQRFAQYLQDLAVKLRQLVKKQHAMVRQGDFTGLRAAAAADQCRPGGAVVGLAERPPRPVL